MKRQCGCHIETRRLWPELRKIVAIGVGEYSTSRQYVMDELHAREYKIAWNNGSLLLPETIIADSKEDNSDVFILNTENCF